MPSERKVLDEASVWELHQLGCMSGGVAQDVVDTINAKDAEIARLRNILREWWSDGYVPARLDTEADLERLLEDKS